MNSFSIIHAIASKLNLTILGDDGRLVLNYKARELTSHRNARILSHYQTQVDLGRMSPTFVVERAIDDLMGRNHHPEKAQASYIKF